MNKSEILKLTGKELSQKIYEKLKLREITPKQAEVIIKFWRKERKM